MTLNLSGWYNGLIGLENKVIDLSRMEIRPRATEKELNNYYDECIDKLSNHENYFEDESAFKKTLEEVAASKRAKLIARDSVYPGIFNFKEHFTSLENIFDPEKQKTEDKYFHIPSCETRMPFDNENIFSKLVNKRSNSLIKVSREEYEKGYSSIIQIPNDRIKEGTKTSTYHETLHHFINYYQINSGKLFTKDNTEHSKRERRIAENLFQESAVEYLTCVLLEEDENVLFEHLWTRYEIFKPGLKSLLIPPTAIATGLILSSGITNPKLLPLAIVPKLIMSSVYNKYKNSKREGILNSFKKVDFKI